MTADVIATALNVWARTRNAGTSVFPTSGASSTGYSWFANGTRIPWSSGSGDPVRATLNASRS